MKWRLAAILVSVLFLAWLAGVFLQGQPKQGLPVAVATLAPTTRPATLVAVAIAPTSVPTRVPATPTPRVLPRLPAEIPASSGSPAYTITAAPPRRDAEGRHRYELELAAPKSYGRDEFAAVLRHAGLLGLDVFPEANVLLVTAFAVPREAGWGWTGQAIVSRDGRGWSAADPDDGKIHITYTPFDGTSAKLDLDR